MNRNGNLSTIIHLFTVTFDNLMHFVGKKVYIFQKNKNNKTLLHMVEKTCSDSSWDVLPGLQTFNFGRACPDDRLNIALLHPSHHMGAEFP